MRFYGDPYPLQRWPEYGGVFIFPMSTGVVRIFTSEGFVLAADGLMRDIDEDNQTARIVSESVQKIFPVEEHDRLLAYAFTGIVGITGDDPNEMRFNFIDEAASAVQGLSKVAAKNLTAYVTKFCRSINTSLQAAKREGRVSRYPKSEQQTEGERGETIAEVFFDGYYHGFPASVRGRFFHENQRTSKVEIVVDPVAHTRIYGSAKVASLLFNSDDPRFAAYRRPPSERQDIPEAVEIAKNYFRACADPEAMRIDERSCSAIGGHVHIAQITPHGGFQWAVPPKGSLK